jgi:hypothetical protein
MSPSNLLLTCSGLLLLLVTHLMTSFRTTSWAPKTRWITSNWLKQYKPLHVDAPGHDLIASFHPNRLQQLNLIYPLAARLLVVIRHPFTPLPTAPLLFIQNLCNSSGVFSLTPASTRGNKHCRRTFVFFLHPIGLITYSSHTPMGFKRPPSRLLPSFSLSSSASSTSTNITHHLTSDNNCPNHQQRDLLPVQQAGHQIGASSFPRLPFQRIRDFKEKWEPPASSQPTITQLL